MTLPTMAEVHVFYQDRFLCRAICARTQRSKSQLERDRAGQVTARRKQVRAELNTRAAMVNRYVEMHHASTACAKNGGGRTRASRSAATTQEVHQ